MRAVTPVNMRNTRKGEASSSSSSGSCFNPPVAAMAAPFMRIRESATDNSQDGVTLSCAGRAVFRRYPIFGGGRTPIIIVPLLCVLLLDLYFCSHLLHKASFFTETNGTNRKRKEDTERRKRREQILICQGERTRQRAHLFFPNTLFMTDMGSFWSSLVGALGMCGGEEELGDDYGIPFLESANSIDPLEQGVVLAEELRELDVLLKDSGVGKKRTFSDTDAPLSTPTSVYSEVSAAAEAYKMAHEPSKKKAAYSGNPKRLRIKTGSDLELLTDEEIDSLWKMATEHRDKVIHQYSSQVTSEGGKNGDEPTLLDLPTPDMFGNGDSSVPPPGQLCVARAVNACPCCEGTGWYEVRIHYRSTEDGKVQVSRMPASVEHSIEGHRRAVGKKDEKGAMCCCNPPSFKNPQALTPLGVTKLVNDTLALFPRVEDELAPLVRMLREQHPDKA